ncbi:DUF4011 domain-containing protein [Agromyces sp. NPDC058484]|uniref:DUF4011 domain-containing protein n=1 Tax=Agromyces sp. NPDC058484 TaxID=3346524 RepID=UPI0036611D99
MDDPNHHSGVGDALGVLIEGLKPFVERVMREAAPDVANWTSILERRDKLSGRHNLTYSPRDLPLMLRAMTDRLGDLGYPFDRSLGRQGRNYASELREVRNKWAHNEEFTATSAYRAMDSMELLLRLIAADDEADRIAELKAPLLPVRPAVTGSETDGAPIALSPTPAHVALAPTTAHKAPTIEIGSIPFLSYPMALSRIAIVDEISITGVPVDLRAASLEVDIVSATGVLGDPKVHLVDLEAGETTTLRDLELLLDPARMLEIDVQQHGRIRAILRDASGATLAEASVDVQILAGNQWIANPLHLGLELLAAHVQPNAAALSSLLVEASDRLKAATGRGDLDAYQSENPDRVDAIVTAVYDAMRGRDIRYAEPPASWGERGQRVRTPGDVLEDRLGTCLDTTTTLAAALEQAGINTTLWLAKGHIFLGYWRTDNSLGAVATTDPMEIANLVDLGHIALVETTMLTGGADSHPIGEANRAPRTRFLDGDPDQLLGVSDVREARARNIYPLPSRAVAADGTVTITTYQPAAAPAIAPYYGQSARDGAAPEQGPVPRRVQMWKNSLLDLSLRNRLINYTPRAGYRLEVPAPAVARLEDAVNAGATISLLASDDIPSVDQVRGIRFARDLPEELRAELLGAKRRAFIDITEGAYTSKLRYLANKAKTIVEETGANNLYLAFGMLHWRFNDRDLRSPLVLVPVNITTANRGQVYQLTLDEAGASTPNYCLLEKLRISFGLEIPGLQNPIEDESGIDLGAALRAAREEIAAAGLPFRVEESVDLSILQFAKFRLWKDLDDNWEVLAKNPLVSHLIQTPLDPFEDPVAERPETDLDELGAVVPVPADGSQLEAVADAVGGRTFVLEGPPGTGKSQTITNLLARSLAAGKRVLFVAEKRAALDVVKKRLESVGLGDLSLDLHDKSARPAAVRAQIKTALDLAVRADRAKLQADSESAEASRRALARYAQRLHEPNAAGMSLYSARTTELSLDPDAPSLEVPTELVANAYPELIDSLRSTLRRLPETADLARPEPRHPWGFIDEQQGTVVDAAQVHRTAQSFDAALDAAQRAGISLDELAHAASAGELEAWAQVSRAPRHPVMTLDTLAQQEWLAYLNDVSRQVAGFVAPAWSIRVRPTVLAREVHEIHQEALAADASGYFGRKKRRRAVLARFADELVVDQKEVALKTLSTLTGEIAATMTEVEALRAAIGNVPLPLIDSGWNPLIESDVTAFESRLRWIMWLGDALKDRTDPRVAAIREYFASTSAGDAAAELERLVATWREFETAAHVPSRASSEWLGDAAFLRRWSDTRSARRLDTTEPVSLTRWLDFVCALEPLSSAGLAAARTALLRGEIPAEDAAIAFDKGMARASIAEREDATALGTFDPQAHDNSIARFTVATHAVRGHLPRVIPADLLASRTFSATAAGGQVGGLRRQLERQRGGMSVRAMIDAYGELITQIMPCTLMSPESVARFFPARPDLFDIVVFDEASQIRVADAVGAMGRGTSVIVVGDSKQMPPTSFADSSASVDEDIEYTHETVVDEESILSESVQAQVPRKWLSWHYRSQDESLIAFSNHHYYENRLSSFPAPVASSANDTIDGHGISFVRVNGQFQRSGKGKTLRTNRVEADAIVDDIQRRFWASPNESPSVGVITFNAQQRDLIDNLLRDTGDERILRALDEPDGLFVKNLENVQGDERDCILFSIAFSVNDNGVLPLNFGPLGRAGGERRLNVAVTRARRQVILFASFEPDQLRAEQTSSTGIKHLKAYLELAARGVEAVTDDGRRMPRIDRHRDDIADELRAAGYAVRADVGLSEFRVDLSIADAAEPDRPLVAVLLDGENWRARQTVADRDGLPVEVLKGLMRWPGVERVWLPEWLHQRDQVMARIEASVVRAREVASAPVAVAPAAPVTAPNRSRDLADHDALALHIRSGVVAPGIARTRPRAHPDVMVFREWRPVSYGSISILDDLPRRASADQVAEAIRAALATEGPMHSTRLAKAVANSFGLARVSQARADAILRCVPPEFKRGDGERTFVWPEDVDPKTWRGVRRVQLATPRDPEHISLVEIANAMRVTAAISGGMDDTELKRETLALFGGKRLTSAIDARLASGLLHGLESGRLERSHSGHVMDGLR